MYVEYNYENELKLRISLHSWRAACWPQQGEQFKAALVSDAFFCSVTSSISVVWLSLNFTSKHGLLMTSHN